MKLIIVGCGRVGSGLAERQARQGDEVTIIDKNPRAFERLSRGFTGARLHGIGFDHRILVRAGIESADALAAVTSGDNTNFVTARLAHVVFHVPKVIARLYDPRRAEIYQRLGMQTVCSTTWGVQRIAQLLVHPELDVVFSMGGGEVELIEVEAPRHWVSRTVDMATRPGEIGITSITRGGKAFIPTLGSEFQAGDHLTVAVATHAHHRLEELLGAG